MTNAANRADYAECAIKAMKREYSRQVRLEDAVRELWNAEHGIDGLGDYDSFKAKWPRDCKAHGAESWQEAACCAAAWKPDATEIEDGSDNG
jgi:hypothetical protein